MASKKKRYGRQEPTFTTVNKTYDFSYGKNIADLFYCYGITLIPSQLIELDVYGARNIVNGEELVAYNTVCTSRPRQTGKSFAIRLYALFLALMFGKRVLITCHNGDTTREHFKWLTKNLIEPNPSLMDKVQPDGIRRSYVDMGIFLKNGGSIEFNTRTNTLSRGKTYQIVIVDEAQEFTDGQQESLQPVLIASESDSQLIMLGTPPGPLSLGTVFRNTYESVHNNPKTSIAWLEWSISYVPSVTELLSPDLWYEYNPGMGYRITEKKMKNAAESFASNPSGFAREYLGYWSPLKTINPAIDAELWNDLAITESVADSIKGDLAFGVKFSPSGTFGALTIAVRPFDSDQPKLVELYDVINLQISSVSEFADFLAPLLKRSLGCLIDGKNAQAALKAELAARGVKDKNLVMTTKTDTLTDACALFMDAIKQKSLTHCNYSELTDAVTTSTKRMIGRSGAFGFASDGAEATIVESCALAYYLSSVSKRQPNRVQKAIY